jgi:hypothetical protein
MKNAYYFSHDYGARNDPKLQRVIMEMGMEGLGIFWSLIEMMYEQNGCLSIENLEIFSFSLRADPKKIEKVIKNYDLFYSKGNLFFSKSLNARLKRKQAKSKTASENGKKGGAPKNNQNSTKKQAKNKLKQAINERNEMNEMKGNERVVNEMKGKDSKENPNDPQTATSFKNLPDQNGNDTNGKDTATAQQPMSWNEQSQFAQNLGISRGLTEQIISIAKENRIMLFKQHWEAFAQTPTITAIIPLLEGLIIAEKKKSKGNSLKNINSG